jgi:single-strand DNA-binding protein
MLPNITATGRLGNDPELTFTPAGKALAKFRIACGERIKDQQSGEWKDGDTTWLSVALWEKDAEAAAEHLKKGDEVTVVGLLLVRDFEAKDGSKGRSVEVKYGKVSKSLPREKSQGATSGGWSQQPAQTVPADPWSTAPTSSQEPPF